MRLTPEQSDRLDIAMRTTLRHGPHEDGDRTDITRCEACARELACWVMTGTANDETPEGASRLLAALPLLNDGPWRDDGRRTSVIRPYLPRLLTLDPADDERKAYALADYAVRVCAAEALDAAGLPDCAAKLRALAPITDEATANAANAVATYAATYAANAAATAACAANAAATYVAGLAANATATYVAGLAANAADAETIERHTRAILDIICGQMEGE